MSKNNSSYVPYILKNRLSHVFKKYMFVCPVCQKIIVRMSCMSKKSSVPYVSKNGSVCQINNK